MLGMRTVEEPKYAVILETEKFEIRKYNKQLIAKTEVEGDWDEASSKGFRRIAKFIFGDNLAKSEVAMTSPVVNERSSKIAMTAPVVQENHGEKWSMYFIMPEEYTQESLPSPVDSNVQIFEKPEELVAVYKYSGFVNSEDFSGYEEKLRAWALSNNLEIVSGARVARYNPPWSVPFLRRNEIQFTVVRVESKNGSK